MPKAIDLRKDWVTPIVFVFGAAVIVPSMIALAATIVAVIAALL